MSRRRGTYKLDTTQINEHDEHEDGFVVANDAPDGRTVNVRWDDRIERFVISYRVGGREQTIEIGEALAEGLSFILASRVH